MGEQQTYRRIRIEYYVWVTEREYHYRVNRRRVGSFSVSDSVDYMQEYGNRPPAENLGYRYVFTGYGSREIYNPLAAQAVARWDTRRNYGIDEYVEIRNPTALEIDSAFAIDLAIRTFANSKYGVGFIIEYLNVELMQDMVWGANRSKKRNALGWLKNGQYRKTQEARELTDNFLDDGVGSLVDFSTIPQLNSQAIRIYNATIYNLGRPGDRTLRFKRHLDYIRTRVPYPIFERVPIFPPTRPNNRYEYEYYTTHWFTDTRRLERRYRYDYIREHGQRDEQGILRVTTDSPTIYESEYYTPISEFTLTRGETNTRTAEIDLDLTLTWDIRFDRNTFRQDQITQRNQQLITQRNQQLIGQNLDRWRLTGNNRQLIGVGNNQQMFQPNMPDIIRNEYYTYYTTRHREVTVERRESFYVEVGYYVQVRVAGQRREFYYVPGRFNFLTQQRDPGTVRYRWVEDITFRSVWHSRTERRYRIISVTELQAFTEANRGVRTVVQRNPMQLTGNTVSQLSGPPLQLPPIMPEPGNNNQPGGKIAPDTTPRITGPLMSDYVPRISSNNNQTLQISQSGTPTLTENINTDVGNALVTANVEPPPTPLPAPTPESLLTESTAGMLLPSPTPANVSTEQRLTVSQQVNLRAFSSINTTDSIMLRAMQYLENSMRNNLIGQGLGEFEARAVVAEMTSLITESQVRNMHTQAQRASQLPMQVRAIREAVEQKSFLNMKTSLVTATIISQQAVMRESVSLISTQVAAGIVGSNLGGNGSGQQAQWTGDTASRTRLKDIAWAYAKNQNKHLFALYNARNNNVLYATTLTVNANSWGTKAVRWVGNLGGAIGKVGLQLGVQAGAMMLLDFVDQSLAATIEATRDNGRITLAGRGNLYELVRGTINHVFGGEETRVEGLVSWNANSPRSILEDAVTSTIRNGGSGSTNLGTVNIEVMFHTVTETQNTVLGVGRRQPTGISNPSQSIVDAVTGAMPSIRAFVNSAHARMYSGLTNVDRVREPINTRPTNTIHDFEILAQ